jgi:hypothetical protein
MKQPEPLEPAAEEKPDVVAEPGQPVMEDEPEPVAFIDRLIAFFILIGPWSLLLSYGQDLLGDYVTSWVNNMMVLVGIIVFLIAVGYLSKKVYAFRSARWSRD